MRVRVIGTFPLMHEDKQIGSILIYSKGQNKYVYQINVPDKDNSRYLPPSLRFALDRPKTPETEQLLMALTSKWVTGRLFPPDRQNADDILKRLGLRHYDQVDILKKTEAKTVSDRFWIDFKQKLSDDHETPNAIRA